LQPDAATKHNSFDKASHPTRSDNGITAAFLHETRVVLRVGHQGGTAAGHPIPVDRHP